MTDAAARFYLFGGLVIGIALGKFAGPPGLAGFVPAAFGIAVGAAIAWCAERLWRRYVTTLRSLVPWGNGP